MYLQQKIKKMDKITLAKKTIYFKKLGEMDFNAILHCFEAKIESYKKGDVIISFGDKLDYAYMLLSGVARATSFNEDGTLFINLDYTKENIFGLNEIIQNKSTSNETLRALTDVTVILLDKFRFLHPCLNRCKRHIDVLENVFKELSRQSREYQNHKNILELSSTKNKILAFLKNYSKLFKSNEFDIPYSRYDLATYLGVDRSALSYELSKLKKANIIDFKKNHFKLKKI